MFHVQIAMDVALQMRHVYLTVKAATFHALLKILKITLVVMVAVSLTKFAHLIFIVLLSAAI